MTIITTGDGARIFYKDWGPKDAESIVFHHGWPLSADDWDNQVERTIGSGAKLLLGGSKLDSPGYFYAPTVLADVAPGMAAFDEEVFGPVAAITVADDLEHAITP